MAHNKSEMVSVRFSAKEIEAVDAKARALKMTRSEFLRYLATIHGQPRYKQCLNCQPNVWMNAG